MARYALVIGIAKYDNFNNLPTAVNDAAQIIQLLSQHGRFDVQPLPSKLIETANSWQVTSDKKLTGKELGQKLREFLLNKANNAEAVIYFAGHGFEAPSLTGEAKGYLATSDCSKDGQNAIAFDDLNTLISKSQLSSLVVILDCCYAGSLLERSFIKSSFPVFNTKQDYCLITASRAFEKAREDSEGGIFTKAVLKGLAISQADETTGEINVNDLMGFISRELKGSGQEPIYMGGGRSIPLVWYPPKNPLLAGVVNEECPYRGLEAFEKPHAKFFFGRQQVVNSVQQKLAQAKFVPIIGASGSGKSSLVRAGLMPILEENGWRVLEPILPGVEPLAELKRVLTQLFERSQIREIAAAIDTEGLSAVISRLTGSERFLLVIDQFEEIFTLCFKEEDRRKFIELVTQCSHERLAIVTTMRADFLEPCLSYKSLTQLIQEQAVYMPPLLGAELEEVIASPANLQGYELERGLLGTIQHEFLGQEKGCLPLLQFALTELWEQRDRQIHQLTVTKYHELGGVVGALNRHAENLYASFTEQQQDCVKRIFLKLVRTGAEEKDTRQRQPKTKFLSIASDRPTDQKTINYVLEKLIQGRLIVAETEASGNVWLDLAHESLMDGWERFSHWRRDGRELRRLIDRVEDALREWQKQPKDENLMMGGLLAQVREKWPQLQPDLDITTQEFYQLSDIYEKDRIALLEKALAQATLREKAARMLNLFPFQPLAGLILAIQAMGENLQKMPEEILTPIQSSLHQAMETVKVPIPLKGHEDAINSVAMSPDGQIIVTGSVDGTLRLWNIQGNPVSQPFQGHQGHVTAVAISPDGQLIVSGSRDRTLRLWDMQGNPISQPFPGHEGYVASVAFSPDGKMIASGSWDKTVRLWDLSGNPIGQPLFGHKDVVFSIIFSPDGQMIASGSWDNTVRLWDIQGNTINQPFVGHDGFVNSLAISPDGQMIVSGSSDGTVRLWDLLGNIIAKPFTGHDGSVNSVAISPDGQRIFSGGNDNTVRLWDANGQPLSKPLLGHKDAVRSIAISPDGQRIVSGSRDTTAQLWNLADSIIGHPFTGHDGSVNSIAISSNGQMIVSGGSDGTVRLWNTQGQPLSQPFLGHEDAVRSVNISADGLMIVSGSDDGTVRLWDIQGNLIDQLVHKHENMILTVAVSPDGQRIISGSRDGTVQLWDIKYRPVTQPLRRREAYITAIAVSPDGQRIASGYRDGSLQLWDLEGNRLSQPFKGHEYSVTTISFSADGQKIVSGSLDNTVRLWDSTGNPISEPFWGHENYVWSVAFSPDGQLIVSGSDDNTLQLWDLTGNPIGQPFHGHKDSVWSVAFSPNGQLIASASEDGTIRLWRGDWRAWLQVCCDKLRYHPIFKNPQTEEAKAACEVCRKYVWGKIGDR